MLTYSCTCTYVIYYVILNNPSHNIFITDIYHHHHYARNICWLIEKRNYQIKCNLIESSTRKSVMHWNNKNYGYVPPTSFQSKICDLAVKQQSPSQMQSILTHLPPGQNSRHFRRRHFKCIFLYKNDRIPIWISMKFVPRCPIDNITAFVQLMAWRRPGDKPITEPMLTHFIDAYMGHSGRWVKNHAHSFAMFCVGFFHWHWGNHAILRSSHCPRRNCDKHDDVIL